MPLGSGTMHDELPLQQRLESEHRCSGPEQVQAPPESHALLQHSAPFVPPDAPHVADAWPGWRQQVPERHATVVS
jgi:hypothetical protein